MTREQAEMFVRLTGTLPGEMNIIDKHGGFQSQGVVDVTWRPATVLSHKQRPVGVLWTIERGCWQQHRDCLVGYYKVYGYPRSVVTYFCPRTGRRLDDTTQIGRNGPADCTCEG